MAEQTEAIALDDRELFQSAMENEPAVAEKLQNPRDELGRFAPKAEPNLKLRLKAEG
jgi:hypothetical protein